jgi:citrate synthase
MRLARRCSSACAIHPPTRLMANAGVKSGTSSSRPWSSLCADHELNVSSFTARCVASAGSHPYAVVLAGLAALEGTKHGGFLGAGCWPFPGRSSLAPDARPLGDGTFSYVDRQALVLSARSCGASRRMARWFG